MPYRLACTATPAPNDYTELGTHSGFLGVMRRDEMLPRWFIHDSADTGAWRIKGMRSPISGDGSLSWARCVSLPSDLGFDDTGYVLPAINVTEHMVASIGRRRRQGNQGKQTGQMRFSACRTRRQHRSHKEKRLTAEDQADLVAECIDSDPEESWIVWCDTDYKADAVARVPGAEEVPRIDGWRSRRRSWTPSPAAIFAHWSPNLRSPAAASAGSIAPVWPLPASRSHENCQAIRRCWRFGQKRPVKCISPWRTRNNHQASDRPQGRRPRRDEA